MRIDYLSGRRILAAHWRGVSVCTLFKNAVPGYDLFRARASSLPISSPRVIRNSKWASTLSSFFYYVLCDFITFFVLFRFGLSRACVFVIIVVVEVVCRRATTSSSAYDAYHCETRTLFITSRRQRVLRREKKRMRKRWRDFRIETFERLVVGICCCRRCTCFCICLSHILSCCCCTSMLSHVVAHSPPLLSSPP